MFGRKKSTPDPVLLDMQASRRRKFETLVDAISSDLFRYACWVCKDRYMAEELVQETYLRAWKSLDRLRDADAAKSWLFTIFRREYARQFERIRPKLESLDELPDFVAVTHVNQDAETYALRRALAKLPEEYREPLVLQVLGGFSCREIAEITGLTTSTVMTRVFRARKKMRDSLLGTRPGKQQVADG